MFQSHGYLSSANCHVDSRWVLKISGFALHAFRTEHCSEQVSSKTALFAVFAADHITDRQTDRQTDKQTFCYIHFKLGPVVSNFTSSPAAETPRVVV